MASDIERTWSEARLHEQELVGDIREAHCKGQGKRAEYLQRRYLTSYDAKLVAARRGYRAMKLPHRPDVATLPDLASRLDARTGTAEKVTVRPKAKKNNPHESRLIMEFGIENRSLQYLLLPCIAARADLDPNQYFINGGRDAAMQHVHDALLAGFDHVVEMDIKNCYPSFNGEKLSGLLPIPKGMYERVILSRDLNLYPENLFGEGNQFCNVPYEDSYVLEEIIAEARQGIAQGSAVSGLVAEVLLAPVIGQLPKLGIALTYADNILIMARTAEDAVSMSKALRMLLHEHPAGPLKLNEQNLWKPGYGGQFLGYRLTLHKNTVHFAPSHKNYSKFMHRFTTELKRTRRPGISDSVKQHRIDALRKYVMGWSCGFSLWSGVEQHRKKHLSQINEAAASTVS